MTNYTPEQRAAVARGFRVLPLLPDGDTRIAMVSTDQDGRIRDGVLIDASRIRELKDTPDEQ